MVKTKRANPEHKLQAAVREYLVLCLPPEIEWTANAAGVHVTVQTANKMKAAGVRRGWPDLQFLFPDGLTRYIELKTKDGALSPEQREFRDRCRAIRTEDDRSVSIWALCRSIDEVAVTLAAWGVTLRAHPFMRPIAADMFNDASEAA